MDGQNSASITKMLNNNTPVLLLVLAIVHVQCLPVTQETEGVQELRLLERSNPRNEEHFRQQTPEEELQMERISKRHAQHHHLTIDEIENHITNCLHGIDNNSQEASAKPHHHETKRYTLESILSGFHQESNLQYLPKNQQPIIKDSQPGAVTVKDLIEKLTVALNQIEPVPVESTKEPEVLYGTEKIEGQKNGTTFKYEMYEDAQNTDVLLHEMDERGNEIFLRVYGPSVISENEDFTAFVTAYKNGNRAQFYVTRHNGHYSIKDYDYNKILFKTK